ncbi:MAG: CRISPR-associated endonuclease Cas1 [Crenarchaeota archaeon]|nr:CRISPR-associated endonuclease Cas1 [Thermoproteota archaeon]
MALLVIRDYGVRLRFRKGLIIVEKKGKILDKIPLSNIEQILILTSGVSLTSKLVRACARNFIDIVFIDHRGEPLCRIFPSVLGGTVIHRREQYESYMNGKGVKFVKACIYGKITNQANLLKYLARNRKRRNPEIARDLENTAYEIENVRNELTKIEGACIDTIRQDILTIEAKAARKYWECISKIIPETYGFNGRDRESDDVVNKTLNYAYGILKTVVWKCVLLHNLDPYAGYLHVDRSGRPSLVLDMMEEFRPLIDKIVISIFTQEKPPIEKIVEEDGRLKNTFRSELVRKISETLRCEVKRGLVVNYLESIVNKQVRMFVRFLKGVEEYKPHIERF